MSTVSGLQGAVPWALPFFFAVKLPLAKQKR
jgi:hypothetical protein